MRRLFISKHIEEIQDLVALEKELDVKIIAQSFIDFRPIDFSISAPYEVIFFSSKRAVQFFIEKEEIDPGVKIACAGESTRNFLERRGISVAFTAPSAGNIHESSDAFLSWLGDQKVLFPVSDRSLHSYSNPVPDSQKQIVEIYQTIHQKGAVEACDVYVFTSPSNVEGFLVESSIPQDAQVIAWGSSTAACLLKNQIQVTNVLESAQTQELIHWLK